MKIDLNIQHAANFEVCSVLTDESIREVKEESVKAIGKEFWDLTVSEFLRLKKKDFSVIGVEKMESITTAQFYWIECFGEWCRDEFIPAINACAVRMKPIARKAAEKAPQMSFEEGLLIFGREYFGLHSFAEAEALKLSDIWLAKRDSYAKGMFQYYLNELQEEEFHKHTH